MTVLKRVTQKEMKRRTGFGKALGYSFPKEDEILIRDDLPKDLEHEVIAHEEDHMSKGEEGPFAWTSLIGPAIGVVGSLFGGKKQADAAKDAARTAAAGSERELQFARESRDLARGDQAPYRNAGYKALDALMSLTGLGGGSGGGQAAPSNIFGYNDPDSGMPNYKRASIERANNVRGTGYSRYRNPISRARGGFMGRDNQYNINELGPESVYSGGAMTRNSGPATIDGRTGYVQPNQGGHPNFGGNIKLSEGANTTALNPQTGYPNENPGGVEGGYQFQTDPGYQFRFEEGQRALDRGAAARGGLLSGGYGRKAIRYGQGFASNEYTNVYNRIANIAGLGQTSSNQSGQYAMYGGQQMGRGAANSAFSQASGQQAAGNAWANAGNQIAQLPWGNIFNQPGTTDTTPVKYGTTGA